MFSKKYWFAGSSCITGACRVLPQGTMRYMCPVGKMHLVPPGNEQIRSCRWEDEEAGPVPPQPLSPRLPGLLLQHKKPLQAAINMREAINEVFLRNILADVLLE